MPKTIVMKGAYIVLALCLATISFTASAAANANGSGQARTVPTRGMTMARVRSHYGKPNAREPAVGNPPYTRWKYAHFIVYFEDNRVIDSVIPGHPPPVYHRDQLKPRPSRMASR